jgi:hypothetical protein
MNRKILKTAVPLLVAAALVAGSANRSSAEVNVGVNVNLGPPVVAVEPPAMVLVPRTQVFFAPGLELDIFFHNGYWWSPRGDRWYRARSHSGPWQVVERRLVPAPVIRVPKGYRTMYVKERHIPYREWRDRHERREQRREMKEERRERKEELREHRQEERERERGDHGRGHER